MIETVSRTGGHLASNLGAIELSIALHRVFESPKDKIIWDVGHQSYSHKLITGRQKCFSSLRQQNGLSGFPDREESEHDHFIGGHAGTSVSAALGMALARDLSGQSYDVVAVIGDGSLGSGVALEGINHAGHIGSKIIVVVNDNGMSISPRVGTLYRLVNRVRLDPRYEAFEERFRKSLRKVPGGELALSLIEKGKRLWRETILPGTVWEELGFSYLGPVDGHNIEELEAAFRRARDHEINPTVIHAVTCKGKGYCPAEEDAVSYHGVSPIKKGAKSPTIFSRTFGEAVAELMSVNSQVVAITAAMLDGTGLVKAARLYPERVFDVGICEQHAVTLAAGLATQGYIPIVAIYSSFLQRSYDQIVHDVCLQNLPVIFAIDRAGIVGDDGKTHQGALDVSYLRCIPNLIVAEPMDGSELKELLKTALDAGSPFAVRYPRGAAQAIEPRRHGIPIGRAEILKQGSDIAIFALGHRVHAALEASVVLDKLGISCAVINARFVKPIDREMLVTFAKRCSYIVTLEENAISGGFGSAVMQCLAEEGIWDIRIRCIGIPDRFIEHGSQEAVRKDLGLDSNGIVEAVRADFPELFLGVYEHAAEKII